MFIFLHMGMVSQACTQNCLSYLTRSRRSYRAELVHESSTECHVYQRGDKLLFVKSSVPLRTILKLSSSSQRSIAMATLMANGVDRFRRP